MTHSTNIFRTISKESQSPDWQKFNPPEDVRNLFLDNPHITIISTASELIDYACGGPGSDYFEVSYEVQGYGRVVEAYVCRVRNGVCANYTSPYMRKRDADAIVIGDDKLTDKITFQEKFGYSFATMRQKTFEWLKKQPLLVYGFIAGKPGMGLDAMIIAPSNAGFFAFGLALLQGIIPYNEIPENFNPQCIIYVAPTFRITHFEGRQVVVHNRIDNLHEIFSYNLYPEPSAKKLIYSALVEKGETEGWVTAQSSVVEVVEPYDNSIILMHEGASGAGKSEMLELPYREPDGRLLLGKNIITQEERFLQIPRTCEIHPIADDMVLCHPSIQNTPGKLCITDAEDAWFVRTNHIETYGRDVSFERLTANPPEPLLFLNIDAAPGSRALIWEHIQDGPGKPCTNPRVTIPRRVIHNIKDGPVAVDIRSFGIRTPPCTREKPSYGIIGLFHLLPPALAWLWRLVSPRGYDNLNLIGEKGLRSEGVGSYWSFATGRRIAYANLLLDQILRNPQTGYVLTPNQYIGAWKVGFMPLWLTREYLARHGSVQFRSDQVRPSRCPLLGSTLFQMHVEGTMISRWFLMVETQPEVGEEAYDIGAKILYNFFRECLADFRKPSLTPLGQQIIECCFDEGCLEDYQKLISF